MNTVDTVFQTSDIAHVIALSIAPVFLLTGIGAMLSVLSSRLGRVVDRARELEERLDGAEAGVDAALRASLAILARRARMMYLAIALCTVCALLVCMVIVVLFVGTFMELKVADIIAVLFILSMLSLISSLVIFLWEIRIATASLRIGRP